MAQFQNLVSHSSTAKYANNKLKITHYNAVTKAT